MEEECKHCENCGQLLASHPCEGGESAVLCWECWTWELENEEGGDEGTIK